MPLTAWASEDWSPWASIVVAASAASGTSPAWPAAAHPVERRDAGVGGVAARRRMSRRYSRSPGGWNGATRRDVRARRHVSRRAAGRPGRPGGLGRHRHHDHRRPVRRRDVAPAGGQVRPAGDPVQRLPAARRLPPAPRPAGGPADRAAGGRRWGRVSMIHFDAHADTGDTQFGSLYGHGTPMRRLIESGAVRGDRFLQVGLRGYWPEPETLDWMAGQNMRCYEMSEVVARGLDECLTEAFAIATDECDGVFLSVDVDVVDPGMAPGTGTPEPGGLTSRQLLDAVRRIAMELPVAGIDIVEVAPPYDHAEVTAYLANRVVLEALSGIAWRRKAARSQNGVAGPLPRRPESPLLDGR